LDNFGGKWMNQNFLKSIRILVEIIRIGIIILVKIRILVDFTKKLYQPGYFKFRLFQLEL